MLNLNGFLCLAGCALAGTSIGLHFGILDGLAAGLTVYALMPYRAPGR